MYLYSCTYNKRRSSKPYYTNDPLAQLMKCIFRIQFCGLYINFSGSRDFVLCAIVAALFPENFILAFAIKGIYLSRGGGHHV